MWEFIENLSKKGRDWYGSTKSLTVKNFNSFVVRAINAYLPGEGWNITNKEDKEINHYLSSNLKSFVSGIVSIYPKYLLDNDNIDDFKSTVYKAVLNNKSLSTIEKVKKMGEIVWKENLKKVMNIINSK
jgi:hypothetical protein